VRRVSTPPFLELPDGVRSERRVTPRGDFAVLAAAPEGAQTRDPVLLVPGFTGSKEDFIAIIGPIASAGHPVTALDQRGQYETAGGDDPSAYDVKALAEDLISVVATLGGPVHLVGHSFGGLVVRAAALADPGRVQSVTLLCSGPAAMPPPASGDLQRLVQALPTTPMETIWAVKRHLDLDGRPGPPAVIEDFMRHRFLANSPLSLLRIAEQMLTEPDRSAELAALGRPTLVAFGTADEAWPPAVQRDMATRLGAEVAEIEGAAHSPAAERPEETTAVLTRFWAST
jgi:pimeloyl-ACP methyl ester carboxylesterase